VEPGQVHLTASVVLRYAIVPVEQQQQPGAK
jgi:hypothetical protein